MFIKNYDKKSELGYFLGVDVQYPKILYERYCDLPFLPERKKLGKKEKLVTNLHDKNEYVVHIRNLKQALNHELILKKVHRVIGFNQDEWLKPFIEMSTKLRQTTKNEFEKGFFKLMNNAVFDKTMENVRKYKDKKACKNRKKMELFGIRTK